MNCHQTLKLLSAYLDNELASAHAARVRDHLRGCPACAQRLAQYEKLQSGYAAQMRPAPSNFTAQVMARIAHEEAQSRRGGVSIWEWFSGPAARFATASAVVAVLATVVLLARHWPQTPTESTGKAGGAITLRLRADDLDRAAVIATVFAQGCNGRVLSESKSGGALALQIEVPENRLADLRACMKEENFSDLGAAQARLAQIAPGRDDLAVSLQSTKLDLPNNIVLSPLPISTVAIGASRAQREAVGSPRSAPPSASPPPSSVVVELEIRLSESR
jgi:hypothetical protein